MSVAPSLPALQSHVRTDMLFGCVQASARAPKPNPRPAWARLNERRNNRHSDLPTVPLAVDLTEYAQKKADACTAAAERRAVCTTHLLLVVAMRCVRVVRCPVLRMACYWSR